MAAGKPKAPSPGTSARRLRQGLCPLPALIAGLWLASCNPDEPVAISPPEPPPETITFQLADAAPLTVEQRATRVSVARSLMRSARFDQSEVVLAALLREFPDDAQVRFLHGLSVHKQKRYAQALTEFDAALALGEFSERPHVSHYRAWALYHLGRMEEAANAFADHVRVVPEAEDSWYGMGSAELELDLLETARQHLLRALELVDAQAKLDSQERSRIVARLGDLALRQDRSDDAASLWSQAVELWPDHYEVWHRLARIHEMRGDATAAEAALTKAREAQARVEARRSSPS